MNLEELIQAERGSPVCILRRYLVLIKCFLEHCTTNKDLGRRERSEALFALDSAVT